MDFGLGLILSFTDNASAGLNSAVSSLDQLTTTAQNTQSALGSLKSTALLASTSVAAQNIGNGLLDMGKGVAGLLLSSLNKVRATGQEYEDFGVTLESLYGGAKKANQAMKNLMDFSVKSPLEVGEVKDFLITLKSQGVDPFKKMKGSVTGLKQETLAWLTDLKSFKPEVISERFKMAIQNYVGSGESKQMRTVFDMGDIEDVIGHKKGSTAQDRMEDIVEFVEKTKLSGLSDKLAVTWTGVASNIDDAFTKLTKTIADNGVFKKLKNSFMTLAQVVTQMPDKDIQALGKTIADALNVIVAPLEKATIQVSKFLKSMTKLAQSHPKLLKFGIVLTSVSGALLLFSGVAFKAVGSIANLILIFRMLAEYNTSVAKMFTSGLKSMTLSIAPLIIAGGLLYTAWRTDFAGLKTEATNLANHIGQSFAVARELMSMNLIEMQNLINSMSNSDNPWDTWTLGLTRAISFVTYTLEALFNNDTLIEDHWQRANALGILPLIEGVIKLKWRVEEFIKGFKKGFKNVSDSVKSFIEGLTSNNAFKGTIFDTLLGGLQKFLNKLTSGDLSAWYDFGVVCGEVATKAVLIAVALKGLDATLGKVFKIGSKIVTMIMSLKGISLLGGIKGFANIIAKVFGSFGKLGGNITKLIPVSAIGTQLSKLGIMINDKIMSSTLFSGTANFGMGTTITEVVATWGNTLIEQMTAIGSKALAGLFSAGAGPVLAVLTAIIVPIIAYALTKGKEFKDKIMSIVTTVKEEFLSVVSDIKNGALTVWDSITSFGGELKDSFSGLIDSVTRLKNALSENETFMSFIGVLSEIGSSLMDVVVPAFKGVVRIISSIFSTIVGFVTGTLSGIIGAISQIIGGVINFISGALDVVTGLLTGNKDLIMQGLSNMLLGIVKVVTSIPKLIWDVFGSLATGVVNILGSVISTVGNLVLGVGRGLINAGKFILVGFVDLVKGGVSKVFSVVDKIQETMFGSTTKKWEGLKSKVFKIFDTIKDGIKNGMDKIKEFLNFDFKIPKLKMPHFTIKGKFSLAPPQVPKLDVKWYEKGAVFSNPSVIGVGENGKEAVMPLEKNTGWIDSLASKLNAKTPVVQGDNSQIVGILKGIVTVLKLQYDAMRNLGAKKDSLSIPKTDTIGSSSSILDTTSFTPVEDTAPKKIIITSDETNEGAFKTLVPMLSKITEGITNLVTLTQLQIRNTESNKVTVQSTAVSPINSITIQPPVVAPKFSTPNVAVEAVSNVSMDTPKTATSSVANEVMWQKTITSVNNNYSVLTAIKSTLLALATQKSTKTENSSVNVSVPVVSEKDNRISMVQSLLIQANRVIVRGTVEDTKSNTDTTQSAPKVVKQVSEKKVLIKKVSSATPLVKSSSGAPTSTPKISQDNSIKIEKGAVILNVKKLDKSNVDEMIDYIYTKLARKIEIQQGLRKRNKLKEVLA